MQKVVILTQLCVMQQAVSVVYHEWRLNAFLCLKTFKQHSLNTDVYVLSKGVLSFLESILFQAGFGKVDNFLLHKTLLDNHMIYRIPKKSIADIDGHGGG